MTRAKTLMKGFFVLAFARGEYDEGYARTLVGTLDGKNASEANRTHTNPGATRETSWGSNEIESGGFRFYAYGQSQAVFDPSQPAEADRGASATASLRDFGITYRPVITHQTRAQITSSTFRRSVPAAPIRNCAWSFASSWERKLSRSPSMT